MSGGKSDLVTTVHYIQKCTNSYVSFNTYGKLPKGKRATKGIRLEAINWLFTCKAQVASSTFKAGTPGPTPS